MRHLIGCASLSQRMGHAPVHRKMGTVPSVPGFRLSFAVALVVALLLPAPRLRRSPPACPRTVRLRRCRSLQDSSPGTCSSWRRRRNHRLETAVLTRAKASAAYRPTLAQRARKDVAPYWLCIPKSKDEPRAGSQKNGDSPVCPRFPVRPRFPPVSVPRFGSGLVPFSGRGCRAKKNPLPIAPK
jgi:hypothetical protein